MIIEIADFNNASNKTGTEKVEDANKRKEERRRRASKLNPKKATQPRKSNLF